MAIQPRYAQAILARTKLVEFRKRALAADVRTVLIYETAPTQAVIGRFTVGECLTRKPTELWAKFGRVGGITPADFDDYYAGRSVAVGLTVSDVVRFRRPVALTELGPPPAVPQSFTYLDVDVLDQINSLQPDHVGGLNQVVDVAMGLVLSPARALVAAGRALQ